MKYIEKENVVFRLKFGSTLFKGGDHKDKCGGEAVLSEAKNH